jgi:sodium transport system ATP-binding protein
MIQISHLSKRFSSDVLAVDDLSFAVQPGEVYGLLGPNGAGKTTTLRMVMGLLLPTSGEALIAGCSVADHPILVKRNIGLVSASAGLYQWLTPREVLHFFAEGYGLDRTSSEDRVQELARRMELQSFLDRRCAQLSTGQAQRVNLARALVHDPPVVLLDEPTRGLDVVGSKIVFDYVEMLRESSKVVVVCTHQLDEAERLCDRFGLLHQGRMAYEGTLDELRGQTGLPGLVQIFLNLLRQQAPHLPGVDRSR